MSHAYRLSAHKLISDVELPELMPWDGCRAAPAELRFRLGKLPARLEGPDHEGGGFATQGRYRYLLDEEDRILVENGSEVTVEPAPGTDLTETRALLMGPVQAVLWHQRGLLPLHASVVGFGGRTVALAGPSGICKSTLAAAFFRAGHTVLADDICIVDTAEGAAVLPSTPRLRLWRDALDHFGIAVDGLPRALSRREKYLIEGGAWDGAGRQRLVAVVLLSRQEGGAVAIERLYGARSIIELHEVVHMLPAARALGLAPAVFAAVTSLPAAGVTVWRLTMPDNRAYLDQATAKVAAILDG
jgi:hypothetical protein